MKQVVSAVDFFRFCNMQIISCGFACATSLLSNMASSVIVWELLIQRMGLNKFGLHLTPRTFSMTYALVTVGILHNNMIESRWCYGFWEVSSSYRVGLTFLQLSCNCFYKIKYVDCKQNEESQGELLSI